MGERSLNRIIDANLNRLKEGIRVVEDINRFFYDNHKTAKSLKELRHLATLLNYTDYLQSRDIINDVLKETLSIENGRENIEDIIISNMKRGQESARVLEEVFKVIDLKESEKFKKIRYSLYNIELNMLSK
jgi:thiamine-phosphate pyrophosphorylase